VLNLTKVENQTILTDVTTFNLSEQIRSAVLLFEEKWTEKQLELQLEFDEYTIDANEELLRHVWINLIDNAVKFAGRCGTVGVTVHEEHDRLVVAVSNTDSEIAPDKLERIFNKFYQGDESHATEGNGIGLAIVRRVVELHGGEVCAESANGLTTFTVQLPKRQG
jgi:signal transduction histidine kinase